VLPTGIRPGNGVVAMSYVKHVLQPDEKVAIIGRVSWIVYHRAICFLIGGIVLIAFEHAFALNQVLMYATAAIFGALTLIEALRAWCIRWTTEIAVTNKRIIFKRGFITRHTAEMNMDKVASVDVDQSIWGRMFDYGTVRIVGTGGSPGIERLTRIGSPIALRNAIDVR
jgi:uncharacterized membrane protein YdbT with pleckstrin-like domain